MVLKIVEYKQKNGEVYEVANFIDNITHASVSANDDVKMPEVRCTFESGAVITVSVPSAAFLMNDSGKTIEKIYNGYDKEVEETMETLHEALDVVLERSAEN